MEWKKLSIVQRHKAREIKTWYLRENSAGRISYKSLGTKNKRTAEACLQRLLVLRFALPGEYANSVDIKEIAKRFLSRPGINANSAEQYARIIDEFSTWCLHHHITDILKFNVEDAKKFYESLSGKSAKQKCSVCGVFLNWCYRECNINKIQPFKMIEYRKSEKKLRDSWNSKQIEQIIRNAPSSEMRVLWALMAFAGLRINEATNLTQSNIEDNLIRVIGKGNKPACLPINKKLSKELKRFGSLEDGLKISKQKSIRALAKTCKKLGISGWASNHKFRHSYATNLASNGCPVAVAMRLLRHSSSNMTLDIYTHILSDDLKKWVEKI
jgi:site-specific recombinase XerD